MQPNKSFEERVPDDLKPGLDLFRQGFGGVEEFNPQNVVAVRERLHDMFEAALAAMPKIQGIEIGKKWAPASDHPDGLYLRTYRPARLKGAAPCIYWIHGGGMDVGATRYDDAECSAYAEAVGAMVVSVEYRLAPEHPYPAGVEDCYAGLDWVFKNTRELGIDGSRIAIAGRSGGGVLAAATALLWRDRGGAPLAMQCLIYPMLDDRNTTPSAVEFRDVISWGGRLNISAWRAVLGDRFERDVPCYAAPARASVLAGLPPTFMQAGDLEVFRDECIDYAQRLMAQGVPCEFHVHPGAYHAADMFNPGSALAARMAAERFSALRRAFGIT